MVKNNYNTKSNYNYQKNTTDNIIDAAIAF